MIRSTLPFASGRPYGIRTVFPTPRVAVAPPGPEICVTVRMLVAAAFGAFPGASCRWGVCMTDRRAGRGWPRASRLSAPGRRSLRATRECRQRTRQPVACNQRRLSVLLERQSALRRSGSRHPTLAAPKLCWSAGRPVAKLDPDSDSPRRHGANDVTRQVTGHAGRAATPAEIGDRERLLAVSCWRDASHRGACTAPLGRAAFLDRRELPAHAPGRASVRGQDPKDGRPSFHARQRQWCLSPVRHRVRCRGPATTGRLSGSQARSPGSPRAGSPARARRPGGDEYASGAPAASAPIRGGRGRKRCPSPARARAEWNYVSEVATDD